MAIWSGGFEVYQPTAAPPADPVVMFNTSAELLFSPDAVRLLDQAVPTGANGAELLFSRSTGCMAVRARNSRTDRDGVVSPTVLPLLVGRGPDWPRHMPVLGFARHYGLTITPGRLHPARLEHHDDGPLLLIALGLSSW